MTIVLLLALAWLVANAALVLMLRRSVRTRERAPRARVTMVPPDIGDFGPVRMPSTERAGGQSRLKPTA